MAGRDNSPTPPTGQLTTGVFHKKKTYARWREQGAPGWLLVYTLDGMGRFGHEQGELLAKRGDLVLVSPRTLNDYGLENTLKRWDLLWAYFFARVDWHVLLKWPEVVPGIMRLRLPAGRLRKNVVDQLTETHRLNTGPRRHREMLAMNSLEKTLLLCDEINPRSEQASMDPRVLMAMDYLCENMSKSVTLASLARKCGMSVSRLAHVFRDQVGQPPHQFLEIRRVTYARQLLELTHESVANIASEVGFPDQFHFSRRFKHFTGLSPRAYRQKALGSQV